MADGYAYRVAFTDYNAEMERALGQVLAMAASATTGRPGVRPGPGAEVTIGGTPESATVAPWSGIVTADGETYLVIVPEPVVLALPTRPAAGSSRIHLVAARIVNSGATETASVKRELDLYIEAGNAAASPSEPSLAPGRLRLRRLAVPSTGNISVAAVAPRSVAAGGVLPVASEGERDAIEAPYDGLLVYREDTDRYEGRIDGAWETLLLRKDLPTATGWTIPASLAAGFTARQGLGHRVNADGEVELTGAVSWTGSGGWTTIFTLPAGRRPESDQNFPASSNTGVAMGVKVSAAGQVQVWTSGTTNAYIPLTAIRFTPATT